MFIVHKSNRDKWKTTSIFWTFFSSILSVCAQLRVFNNQGALNYQRRVCTKAVDKSNKIMRFPCGQYIIQPFANDLDSIYQSGHWSAVCVLLFVFVYSFFLPKTADYEYDLCQYFLYFLYNNFMFCRNSKDLGIIYQTGHWFV